MLAAVLFFISIGNLFLMQHDHHANVTTECSDVEATFGKDTAVVDVT